jgi:hypothetical protein
MPNAATSSLGGYTPTITIAATPHSAANHPPAAYLTCQVSTASAVLVDAGLLCDAARVAQFGLSFVLTGCGA